MVSKGQTIFAEEQRISQSEGLYFLIYKLR